jgi:hypothetical protein
MLRTSRARGSPSTRCSELVHERVATHPDLPVLLLAVWRRHLGRVSLLRPGCRGNVPVPTQGRGEGDAWPNCHAFSLFPGFQKAVT